MRWEAHTTFAAVAVSTAFHIIRSPQAAEMPKPTLTAGVELWIVWANKDPWTKTLVINASSIDAVFEMPNGERWCMTPWKYDDVPVSILTDPVFKAQDWVVRSQA